MIDGAFEELGDAINLCGVPTKEELEITTKHSPLNWDAVSSYTQSALQPISSFNEKKLAIQTFIEAIDAYCDIQQNTKFTKCVGIRGYPGSGKTWTMLYYVLYDLSKGLDFMTTAMLARRSIQL